MLARGLLVNIAAADGHPVEIMDLTFAVQALCAHYVATKGDSLKNGLVEIPEEIDQIVASTKLATMGVTPDELTQEQIDYLNSWQ